MQQNAAMRLLDLTEADVKNQAADIIFGQMRQVIASMEIEKINRDREAFLKSCHSGDRQRIEQLQVRLRNGESFQDLAKRYSEDSSAPQGGDLGWLSPGETVPPFEQAMDKLQPGNDTAVVESQFGWHLIQVIERRTRNMEGEYKRMQARQALFQQRAEPAFEDWLNSLRGRAYIDNRLDPESSTRRR